MARFYTEDEIRRLEVNPYVINTTDQFINFTAEFNQIFYSRYKETRKPKRILESIGFDIELLGYARIHSITIITFSTRYQIFTYIIFAAARLPVEPKSANPLYFWANPTFRDEDEFITYVDDIQRHSIYTPFLDVDENDTLLTLATCTGDNSERLVLFARRQRTTDTAESIRTALLKLTKR